MLGFIETASFLLEEETKLKMQQKTLGMKTDHLVSRVKHLPSGGYELTTSVLTD